MAWLRSRWFKVTLVALLPLILYLVLVKRASWRPVSRKIYGSYVNTVAFSPDGKSLTAVGSTSQGQLQALLLDANSLTPVRLVATTKAHGGITFTPDFKAVVIHFGDVVSQDGLYMPDYHLELRDTATEKLLWKGGYCGANDAQFNSRGDLLATGASSCGPTVAGSAAGEWSLWLYEKRKVKKALIQNSDKVNCLTFAPDNKTVVSGLRDGTLKLWSTQSRKLLRTLDPPQGGEQIDEVLTVAFAPDSTIIASGHLDKTVRLWDARTGKPSHTLKGHLESVQKLVFSADGSMLASGDGDSNSRRGVVKLWDVGRGQELRTLAAQHGTVTALAFAPDGASLVTGHKDGTLTLWRIK